MVIRWSKTRPAHPRSWLHVTYILDFNSCEGGHSTTSSWVVASSIFHIRSTSHLGNGACFEVACRTLEGKINYATPTKKYWFKENSDERHTKKKIFHILFFMNSQRTHRIHSMTVFSLFSLDFFPPLSTPSPYLFTASLKVTVVGSSKCLKWKD